MNAITTPVKGSEDQQHQDDDKIAVIGLAGRFPGAKTITEFWQNLEQGLPANRTKSIADKKRLFSNFHLADSLCFDAEFFGLSPSEAAMMDPQHRVFLEIAWQAMDDAGYSKKADSNITGVFATAAFNDYVLKHIGPLSYADSAAEYFAMLLGNDKDFIASRTAYYLDLKGPATVVQSACSSGLLAVHQGIQSLLQGEIDIALSGGASICLDLENGYFADEGGPMSPTGEIRPFSNESNGIVGGNGVAAVVLKRYTDAIHDHDHIYAVIHASAVNNDGADRASFTSPSVKGQKAVLSEALHLANLTPAEISYIEAHGTGTPLGDPIEFDAIKQVYGSAENNCFLGSVKANIGHLNTVSGLAGLIKTIGVIHRGVIPPMINFTASNPLLEIDKTRFQINEKPKKIRVGSGYAALSSFGFGGTNVHLIIGPHKTQKINQDKDKVQKNQAHLCLLSAKTASGLERMKQDLARFNSTVDIHDYAATLLHGRATFDVRCAFVASDSEQASNCLTQNKVISWEGLPNNVKSAPVFLFAGQGNQYAGMGHWLYQHRKGYRQIIDQCTEILKPLLNEDIRKRLFGKSDEALLPTRFTQLALFITEYASARLLVDVGIKPAVMLGHSIGEYVAACIAGVFSLGDALKIISERGRLIEQLPSSSMLMVSLSEDQLLGYINNLELSLAVINTKNSCVVSGENETIECFAQKMKSQGIPTHRLSVSHGFHSHLLEPILEQFSQVCQKVNYAKAQYPILSNSTGRLADPQQMMTADYWVEHLRKTVRFSDNVQFLSEQWSGHLCLDLSPGNSMVSLLSQYQSLKVLSVIGSLHQQETDFLTSLATLWVSEHTEIESLVLAEKSWHRLSLPTYPFEQQVHVLPNWQEKRSELNGKVLAESSLRQVRKPEIDNIGYIPCWYPLITRSRVSSRSRYHHICFVNTDNYVVSDQEQTIVKCAQQFSINGDGSVSLNPKNTEDFMQLLLYLKSMGIEQVHCDYAWLLDDEVSDFSVKERGYDGLCRLSQTLINAQLITSLTLMTQNLCLIQGNEQGEDEQALAVGLIRTLPIEYDNIRVAWLDTDKHPNTEQNRAIIQRLKQSTQRLALTLGLRQNNLLQRSMTEFPMDTLSTETDEFTSDKKIIKQGGTYLLIGGLGRIGLILARSMALQQCHLIIMGRTIDPRLQISPKNHPDLAYCIEQGARVTLLPQAADNQNDMEAFVNRCLQQGTHISGVFNLAGRYTKQVVQDISLREKDTNYIAKVKTTKTLLQSLSSLKLDFFVNFSSLASELPGYGNSDYMAANFYQNIVAQKTKAAFPVISIAWDNWQGFGQINSKSEKGLFSHKEAETLSDEQGLKILWRIIASGHHHVLVSIKPFSHYQQQIEQSLTETEQKALQLVKPPAETIEQSIQEATESVEMAAEVASHNPIEAVCLSIFQEALGIDSLNVDDDFVNSGGDSIMAIRLVSRLEKIFQAEISLPDFLGNNTVALFSQYLEQKPENIRTAEAYLHLQSLSPQERQQLTTAQ